jgi:hypothetical protein
VFIFGMFQVKSKTVNDIPLEYGIDVFELGI